MATGTPADKAQGGQVQGEGDYEAGRRFDRKQEDFVKSGQVDEAARRARPDDPAQASDMADAEQEGKSHSKGEAPGDMSRRPGRSDR